MYLPSSAGIYSSARTALPSPVPAGDPLLAAPGFPSRSPAPLRADLVTMYGLAGLLTGRTLLDRYLVDEVVGRGGMGAVYRARDLRLGREVALKVIAMLAPDAATHDRLRARFHREARAAAALHHVNVVGVHDFGTDPALGIDFLVMERLRGEDLASRLERTGAPALRTALDILYQAARGVAAGHRAGMIHLDVQPGNLFLEPGDRVGEVQVKVLDFGIAPFSPAYASPEQRRGERVSRPATDVFSLGAVGFHLLTGRRAFTAADPVRASEEVAEGLAALPPHLPTEVRSLLHRALAVRPEDRFPDTAALADALEPVVASPRAVPNPSAAALLAGSGHLEAARRSASRSAPATVTPGRSPAPGAYGEALRGGGFRRTVRAVWHFCVTTVAVGLLAASWMTAANALVEGDTSTLNGGVASASALAPLAVHRLLGRRGSYACALVGSLAVTLGAHILLAPVGNAPALLAAVCTLQLLSSALAERLTHRRRAGG